MKTLKNRIFLAVAIASSVLAPAALAEGAVSDTPDCKYAHCYTTTAAERERITEYGKPIGQDEAQQKATAFMLEILKDPSSATYQWAPIAQGSVRDGLLFGGATHFGYTMMAKINARNSYGGFTGAQLYQFFFMNGELYAVIKAGSDGINSRLL